MYPQQVCMVLKGSIENCKRSWLHKLHTLQCKSCRKWLSSKGCNSVKINSSSIINPHAHLQYVQNRYARFQKDPLKTVGGVDYTNSIPKSVTNGRTDRRTDGQTGANLNAPWLSSRGHKNFLVEFLLFVSPCWHFNLPFHLMKMSLLNIWQKFNRLCFLL